LKRVLDRVDPVKWLQEYTGFKPFSYEEQILRDHALRLRVIRKSRQIGITTTISHEALWKAFTTGKRLILIVSPSLRQSKKPMDIIQAASTVSPKVNDHVIRKSRTEIAFDNDSQIISLPNNPDRLRTFSANDIYLDEAAHFLNDEPVMRALQPMLTATKGTFTIISTPFGKRGLFWERYNHAVNAQGIDPEAKAYDLFPSSISPLIGLDGLEREHTSGAYTELEFRQEFLGEFLEEVDVYYPMALITPCVDVNLQLLERGELGKSYIYGIDFAKKRDETVVVILERIRDPKYSVYHFLVRHIVAWAKMDYSDQIGRIGQLRQKFPPKAAAADQTGVGEGLIEDLKRVLPPAEGIIFNVATKIDMAAGLRALMEATKLSKQDNQPRNTITLPNDKKLIMQINALRYEVSKVGNILFKAESEEGDHDDYLWALALAAYAGREEPLVIQDLFS
jgi:phage FluMu gp28-like protein